MSETQEKPFTIPVQDGEPIQAVTVIDMRESSEMNVTDVRTFLTTKLGEQKAMDTFKGWCKDAAGCDLEDAVLDQAWMDGRYEIGAGCIAVIYAG